MQVLNEAPLIVHFRSSRRRLSSSKMRINICKHVLDTLKPSFKLERALSILWDSQWFTSGRTSGVSIMLIAVMNSKDKKSQPLKCNVNNEQL